MRSNVLQTLASCAILLAVGCFAPGCAKKAVVAPPSAAATPPTPKTLTAPAPAPSPAPAPMASHAPAVKPSDFSDAFFDYDRSALSDNDRTALDADAKVLRDHPDARVTVEGHCDERGTVEYNEALGQRRADVARDYLVSAGANTTQIQTISYGKDRPFCTEHEESCWSRNRCAHVVLNPGSVSALDGR